MNSVYIWEEIISERGKSQCPGQWWEGLACWSYRKEASAAGTERGRGEGCRRGGQRGDEETHHVGPERVFPR